MRYWVYINDKVSGPYEQEKILQINGFTPDTLVCSEIIQEGETQEWVSASSVFATLKPQAAATAATSTFPPAQAQDNKSNEELLKKIESLSTEITGLRKDIEVFMLTQATMQRNMHADEVPTATMAATHTQGTMFPVNILQDGPRHEETRKTDVPSLKASEVTAHPDLPIHEEAEAIFDTPQEDGLEELGSAAPAEEDSVSAVLDEPKAELKEEAKKEDIIDSFLSSAPVIPELEVKPFEQKEEAKKPAPAAPRTKEDLDSEVISSALDSLYKAPVITETPKKEVEFEELLSVPAMEEKKADKKEAKKEEPKAEKVESNEEPKEAPVVEEVVKEEVVEEKKETPAPVEEVAVPVVAAVAAKASDDMTNLSSVQEVSLNEATSLISDFIPPSEAPTKEDPNIPQPVVVQDFNGPTGDVNIGAPEASAHTISAPMVKRIKPSDIKTNPLVAPGMSQDGAPGVEDGGIDQFGVIEDGPVEEVKKSPVKKLVTFVLVLILLAALYFGAVFMKFLPDTFGLISQGGAAAAPAVDQSLSLPAAQEGLSFADDEGAMPMDEETPLPSSAHSTAPVSQIAASDTDLALQATKDYMLPTGQTLLALINTKHPNSRDLVTWTVTKIDDKNFSVTAKVPPEKDQTAMYYYRFNYNTDTKLLAPTTSDSKNLLSVK